MSTLPVDPRHPLLWPDLIELIRAASPEDIALMLVGGAVRDALLGRPIHDIDLVTPADGLHVAQTIANELQAAYYPLDEERRTGRVQWLHDGQALTIDIASIRGESLEEDLRNRDFTINAMASPLMHPSTLIDPLDGQGDLFDHKALRQCSDRSILDDPIRALRAVRMSVQFRLRMLPETRDAAKDAASFLSDDSRQLRQPERCRDELFKLLATPSPPSSVRVLQTLGLLDALVPYPASDSQTQAKILATVSRVSQLVSIIRPRDDNSASNLTLGVAVMILDRYRQHLQEHIGQQTAVGRDRSILLMLASLTPVESDAALWAKRLRLSNREQKILSKISATNAVELNPIGITDREIFLYFRTAGESGVEGLLLNLARYLAEADFALDPVTWGQLLENAAGPILEGYFRRYLEVISPPALISGDDLQDKLAIKPGKALGNILQRLLEEQAAGSITTKKEALRFAERLLSELDYGPTSTTSGS